MVAVGHSKGAVMVLSLVTEMVAWIYSILYVDGKMKLED